MRCRWPSSQVLTALDQKSGALVKAISQARESDHEWSIMSMALVAATAQTKSDSLLIEHNLERLNEAEEILRNVQKHARPL